LISTKIEKSKKFDRYILKAKAEEFELLKIGRYFETSSVMKINCEIPFIKGIEMVLE